jgi:uncharacterized membrane protein YeaQ/YmgE (transglycosylase-associated protein family)
MTASNHVVTGALVVSVVPNPIIGIIAAFFMHFVLDSLPHYGGAHHVSRRFKTILFFDAFVAACVLLAIVLAQPPDWILLAIGGIACASPDLMWLPYWIRELRGQPMQWDKMPSYAKFHSKIQWGERSWGMWIELPYFVSALWLFEKLLAA